METRSPNIDVIGDSNRTHATGEHDEVSFIDFFLGITKEIAYATVTYAHHARAHMALHAQPIKGGHEFGCLYYIGIGCDTVPHLEDMHLLGSMYGKVFRDFGT